MDIQVRELQEKALNGDSEALELYNKYVDRREAPSIYVQQESKSQGLMMQGYKTEAEKRGDSLHTSKRRELTQDELNNASPIDKMAHGYDSIIKMDKEDSN